MSRSTVKRLAPSQSESCARVNTPPCRLTSAIHSARAARQTEGLKCPFAGPSGGRSPSVSPLPSPFSRRETAAPGKAISHVSTGQRVAGSRFGKPPPVTPRRVFPIPPGERADRHVEGVFQRLHPRTVKGRWHASQLADNRLLSDNVRGCSIT